MVVTLLIGVGVAKEKDKVYKEPVEYEFQVIVGPAVVTYREETAKTITANWYRPAESIYEFSVILTLPGDYSIFYSYPESIDYTETGYAKYDKVTREFYVEIETVITFHLPGYDGATLIDFCKARVMYPGTPDAFSEGEFTLTGTGLFDKAKGGGTAGSWTIQLNPTIIHAYRFGEVTLGISPAIL